MEQVVRLLNGRSGTFQGRRGGCYDSLIALATLSSTSLRDGQSGPLFTENESSSAASGVRASFNLAVLKWPFFNLAVLKLSRRNRPIFEKQGGGSPSGGDVLPRLQEDLAAAREQVSFSWRVDALREAFS